MARKPRQEVAGGIFHVYARGNDRAELFLDDKDRRKYLAVLGRAVRRQDWQLLGYCLMPNHVHLLVETPRPTLGIGMHQLHSPYALAFNRRHGRVGHVFQGRYGAVLVEQEAYFTTVVRYIAVNPAAAGLVEVPADWPWSSHRAIAGFEDPPPWLGMRRLLELLSTWSLDPQHSYRELTRPKGA
jgi:REP element-mobilizing transposase RayT